MYGYIFQIFNYIIFQNIRLLLNNDNFNQPTGMNLNGMLQNLPELLQQIENSFF